MVKCSFCGKEMPPGTGKMFVKSDGKIFYFCSTKCEKNMLVLKRKPRRIRWTDLFKQEKLKSKSKKTKVKS